MNYYNLKSVSENNMFYFNTLRANYFKNINPIYVQVDSKIKPKI